MKVDNEILKENLRLKAMELIFESGLKGWNMDSLAEDLGLAKKTLYKMVKSKKELVKQVITDHILGIRTRIGDIVGSIEFDAENYFTAWEEIINEVPALIAGTQTKRIEEIFLEYPEIRHSILQLQDELTGIIVNFIESGIEKGIFKNDVNPELVFELVRAQVFYLLSSGITEKELSEKVHTAIRYLLHGIML
ncbi:MAG: TetR/AcrR family transcriptional regulator [bacterium]|nr:TetR/AcrR family transcriptional regulator [bacterium]